MVQINTFLRRIFGKERKRMVVLKRNNGRKHFGPKFAKRIIRIGDTGKSDKEKTKKSN